MSIQRKAGSFSDIKKTQYVVMGMVFFAGMAMQAILYVI